MTCIVAAVDSNGKVYLGADSSAVDSNVVTSRIMPKVFKKGEFAIGFCHSFRLGQIIEHFFEPPDMEDDNSEEYLVRYMIREFIPEMRSELEVNGYPSGDDEKSEWAIIVGIRGHLFTIESDFHLGYDHDPYASIGAGYEYALGAMMASECEGEELLRVALSAAEHYCPYVIKPFNFIEV